MSDTNKTSKDYGQNVREADEDEQELTFEHGYGAQEDVLSQDESLEDVAGVSEADIKDDLLGGQHNDEADAQEGKDT